MAYFTFHSLQTGIFKMSVMIKVTFATLPAICRVHLQDLHASRHASSFISKTSGAVQWRITIVDYKKLFFFIYRHYTRISFVTNDIILVYLQFTRRYFLNSSERWTVNKLLVYCQSIIKIDILRRQLPFEGKMIFLNFTLRFCVKESHL